MDERGVDTVPEVVWISGSPTIHQGRGAEIRISDVGKNTREELRILAE